MPMRNSFLCSLLLAALVAPLPSQGPTAWVVPGRTVLSSPVAAPLQLVEAKAHVRIVDRAATTTLELDLHNPGGHDQEAVLLLPVPDGAAVSSFAFLGSAAEASARILSRDEARQLYDEITRKLRDPALLEFAGLHCLRSSVFPVPARGNQRIRLSYDHVLDGHGDQVDYLLPRSELLGSETRWTITVELQARAPIGLCHSPSHELEVTAAGERTRTLRLSERSQRDPGTFRLCYTTVGEANQPTAALFAYPDPTIGGGYFLLLASAPAPAVGTAARREVTLVLDRSGSMAGRKLEQAKAAALQVLEGLADGEGIQILDYGNDVAAAFAQPVAKSKDSLARARAHLDAIRPHGGTNIHDALLTALRAPTLPGTVPLVLFLTDGLPTVGPTSEKELKAMVGSGNPHARRVFCFGVGADVNAPLLDRIAETTRAVTAYVLPDEDVEVQVARTFARLGQPVLALPSLGLVDEPARLREVLPRALPDLFVGEQLVVLGQYRGERDLQFVLRGGTPGGARDFRFTLPVQSASTAHAFVPRLWASRQIAFLVDELRQQGGDLGGPLAPGGRDPFADPRLRELRDEILRLSTRYGVLGEYTAFLATEGSRLDDWRELTSACQAALQGRAVATRSGLAAVNQGCNLWAQKQQAVANPRNVYFDASMQAVETAAVQQIGNRAFFRRGDRWIDGNSVLQQRLEPDCRIEIGSQAYFTLLRRLEGERQNGVLALSGDVLLEVDGQNVLIVTSSAPSAPTAPNPIPAPTPTPNPQETVR